MPHINLNMFIEYWITEAKQVEILFSLLNDSLLSQPAKPGFNSISNAAWKLVIHPITDLAKSGLTIGGATVNQQPPATMQKLHEIYFQVVRSVRDQLTKFWGHKSLLEEDTRFPSNWSKESTLLALISKQMALRHNLMNVMRAEGITVPDLFEVPESLKD